MKSVLILSLALCLAKLSFAQENKLYNPDADVRSDVENALGQAMLEGKNILLQIGGNWCGWCIKFHNFCKNDKQLDSALNANFVLVHVNYSKENENEEIMSLLEYPQRFGFPVFVVLNNEGTRVHTQDSGMLEKGEGYDKERVLRFFDKWSAKAINPDTYGKN